jgi:hypothetical protein
MTFFTGVGAIASLVVAAGIAVGVWQVKLTKKQLERSRLQALTDFEDDLSREYRSIVMDLPPSSFYRREPDVIGDEELRAFFRYFDLSNEQLWLAKTGRVRDETATLWRSGILSNLGLPAFAAAWREITEELDPDYWTQLRELVQSQVSNESLDSRAPL